MDENTYEVLSSYKEAIDFLISKLDEMGEKIKNLEEANQNLSSVVFDEILEPTRLAIEESDKNDRFNEFSAKFGEKLDPYNDILKASESDPEYDLKRVAFEQYDGIEGEKPEDVTFVDELIKNVEEKIAEIKKAAGIDPEEPVDVEVKQNENGDTKVKVDGETIAEESTSEKEPATTEDGQGELPFDEDEEDNPEEIADFEKKLEEAMNK